MEIKIKVRTAAGEYVVTAMLMEFVELERRYKTSISALATGISIEQLGFLAHQAAKFEGRDVPPKLDDFLRSLMELSVIEDADAGPPPSPAA